MAYTYRIGWSKQDVHYYGVRSAKNAHPEDLWVSYFTSSHYVEKMRNEHGEPDIVEVRKVFVEGEKARAWETKVIQRMRMVTSDRWLNQTDNTSKWYHEGPRKPFSKEHREKMAAAKRGITISEEHKMKLKEGSRKANQLRVYGESPFKGRKHTEETRVKMREAKTRMSPERRSEIARNARSCVGV